MFSFSHLFSDDSTSSGGKHDSHCNDEADQRIDDIQCGQRSFRNKI